LCLALRLLLAVLHEELDDFGVGYFLRGEDFVEVAFEFLAALLDVLRTVVGNAEDLSLREGGPESATIGTAIAP
jgi:hypothetical protein